MTGKGKPPAMPPLFDKNGMPNPKAAPSRAYQPSRRRGRPGISTSTKAKLLLVLGVLFMGIMGYAFLTGTRDAHPGDNRPQVEQVQNVIQVTDLFIDINGDGQVDYLKYGEVIINQGP